MLLNCGCWRLLRVPWAARRSNQSILKEISPEYSMEDKWCWSWNSNVFFTWGKELTHRKRPWCWERLKAGGEGDDRGWDGWMASPTQWTWVCVNSGSWWWTGRLGVLLSMGLQRVGHDWATELNWWNWTELNESKNDSFFWILSFKPAFSLSCFIFTKRLFSSSSLSAIRVLLSAYLSLLLFLMAILIPAVLHPAGISHDALCMQVK